MLSVEEAHALVREHLGASSRARHSIFVGHAMRCLAETASESPTVWEITGLCHDLDFNVTANDRSQHGLVAVRWLEGLLPVDALIAIQAHDHRTGIVANTPIANALKLSDALAAMTDRLGNRLSELLASERAPEMLTASFYENPYLPTLLLDNAEYLNVPLESLAEICRSAPPSS